MHSLDSVRPEIKRSEWPHHAVMTIKIDIRKINTDGSLDSKVLGNEKLKKYNMTNKAQICTSGVSEADCIKNLKEMLERLNG